MKFRIADKWGEINTVVKWNVVKTIHSAWNYEADVYVINEDGTEDMIFHGWEDNETLSEWLEPYDLRVIDHGKNRYIQSISTGEIHVADWQKKIELEEAE